MTTTKIDIVRKYADDVFARARTPMGPAGFLPDWDDRPGRFTTYPGVPCLPLPEAPTISGGSELAELSALLRWSYGLLSRRTRITWNGHSTPPTSHASAVYGRGAASGGGLYPFELYLVTGARSALMPGVYHYSPPRHALDRLAVGNGTERVRLALGDQPARHADRFLLVGCRFWKNSFKYGDFCYHVVTQDVGALLETWDRIAAEIGMSLRSTLWFADGQVNRVLGLDGAEESVLAVAALPPWSTGGGESLLTTDRPLVVRRCTERSVRVVRFGRVEEVHAATVAERPPADGYGTQELDPLPRRSSAGAVELPPAGSVIADVEKALRARRSSFGGFAARPRMSLAELASLLAVAGSATDSTVRLSLFANHVDDLPGGVYDYDANEHSLHRVSPAHADTRRFLQDNYLLNNYNLGQVAVVLAVVARMRSVLDLFGPRGYRVINARAGRVVQAAYLAAAAAGLGAGAALAFDNITMDRALGLTDGDERSLLFLLAGHERPLPAQLAADLP